MPLSNNDNFLHYIGTCFAQTLVVPLNLIVHCFLMLLILQANVLPEAQLVDEDVDTRFCSALYTCCQPLGTRSEMQRALSSDLLILQATVMPEARLVDEEHD